MPRETIRYDADTIWIRYGYGATRYDTLVRDNDGSLPPDRVREPINFLYLFVTFCDLREGFFGHQKMGQMKFGYL